MDGGRFARHFLARGARIILAPAGQGQDFFPASGKKVKPCGSKALICRKDGGRLAKPIRYLPKVPYQDARRSAYII